ncbi:MAG: hypothetical protein ACIAQZ_02580 [Sedimentisphaeraceae bacterium JB056]
MWKVLNSPIIVVFFAFLLLIGAMRFQKPRFAMELRAASDEIDRIIKESGTDSEKAKAVRDFANSLASNLRDGFKSGLVSGNDGVKELDEAEILFLDVKEKLVVSDIKKVDSGWDNQEKHIFTLKNNSDKYVTSISVSMEYYKGQELLDCEQKWLSNIKVMAPGEEVAVAQTRRLPDNERDANVSDRAVVVPISFTIKNAPQ